MTGKNSLNKYNGFLIGISLILIILVSVTILISYNPRGTSIQDEDVIFYGAINILENNSLHVDLPLNQEYDTCLFSKVGYSMDSNRETYFGVLPTSALFYSSFMSFFGKQIYFYLNLLFVPLIIFFSFLLAKSLTKSSLSALLISLMVITHGIFSRIFLGYYDIMPTILFLLLSLYFILSPKKSIYLSSLFFVIVLALRNSEIIYLPVFALVIIFNKDFDTKSKVLWFIPIILFLFTLPLFNYHFFGDPSFVSKAHITDYACQQNLEVTGNTFYQNIGEISHYFYISGGINSIINHVYYFGQYNLFFYPLFFMGFLGLIFLIKEDRPFFLVILFSFIIATLLYARGDQYFGYLSLNLASSYMRYLLFPSLLIIIGSSVFFNEYLLRIKKSTLVITLFLIIVLSFSALYDSFQFTPNGITEYTRIRGEIINTKNLFETTFDHESIIITEDFTDKYFSFGFKNTIYLKKYELNDKLDSYKIQKDFIDLVRDLLDQNKRVYLVKNSYRDEDTVENILNGPFTLEVEQNFEDLIVYSINKK